MNTRRLIFVPLLLLLACSTATPAAGQQEAIESITAGELRTHLIFIASDEMMGRNTPSPQLKLAARYLATIVESYGWKPLMPDGSFMQKIKLEGQSTDPNGTTMMVGSDVFRFGADFGGSFSGETTIEVDLIFLGFGVEAPDTGWNDYEGLDVEGKMVVMLGGSSFERGLPEGHPLGGQDNRRMVSRRRFTPRQNSAAGIISILSEDEYDGGPFASSTRMRMAGGSSSRGRGFSFPTIQMSPGAGAALLGITQEELRNMFHHLRQGEPFPRHDLAGRRVELTVRMKTETDYTNNVIAVLEGSDPVLKDEYVLFGAHYDHVGFRPGAYPDSINNGADDDGSGTVALLEIAQAMSITRPKRSVVLVWHTGEEKGLWGSRYFVDNSPIPIEKISVQLQMDMLSRNDPGSIYIIGSHFLSSEMDEIDRRVADRLGIIKVDDEYNDPDRRDNYFRQSDHYPYHQVGIPVTFFFCGIHDDLHQVTDEVEKCDFDKLERAVKLIYSVGLEVGNHPYLLKLDRDPEVTSRGKHNRGGGLRENLE